MDLSRSVTCCLRQFSSSNPFVFSTDISRDTMYKIQENNSLYIGVDVQTPL